MKIFPKTFNMTLTIKKGKRPAIIYILKLITIENDVRVDIIYKKVLYSLMRFVNKNNDIDIYSSLSISIALYIYSSSSLKIVSILLAFIRFPFISINFSVSLSLPLFCWVE